MDNLSGYNLTDFNLFPFKLKMSGIKATLILCLHLSSEQDQNYTKDLVLGFIRISFYLRSNLGLIFGYKNCSEVNLLKKV